MKLIKANADYAKEIVTKFGVTKYPFFVIFEDGKEIKKVETSNSNGKFINWQINGVNEEIYAAGRVMSLSVIIAANKNEITTYKLLHLGINKEVMKKLTEDTN